MCIECSYRVWNVFFECIREHTKPITQKTWTKNFPADFRERVFALAKEISRCSSNAQKFVWRRQLIN